MDYTEDKTDDENEEYPRSDAASANKVMSLVEIIKHVFELHGRRGHSKRKYLGGLSLFTGFNIISVYSYNNDLRTV